jgi:chaperonin GroEL
MAGINPRKVVMGAEARQQLIEGANILSNAVKTTLGPKGKNVIIQRTYGPPQVTKDGVTVAREIFLEDTLQDTGSRLVKQAANQTADDIGDGTTTATVLAQAMINEGMKFVTAGISPINLKRGIDFALAHAVKKLETLSRECKDPETIKQVATISANGDDEMGHLIADALIKVGSVGAVTVENSNQLTDELDFVQGLSYDHGFYSPYFINSEKQKCILENPYILILDRPILNVNDLVPILEKLAASGRSFLIMAEQINNDALATLILNNAQGHVKCCAVRSPDWKGEKRKYLIEDVAALTGGTVLSDENGMRPEKAELTDLGQANRVEVTKDMTTIIGGHGDKINLARRIEGIQMEIDEYKIGPKTFPKWQLEERIAKLQGGIAVIRVGGATTVEINEKKDRYDDSIHATRAAIKEGVVAGGGVGYLRLIEHLKTLEPKNEEQRAGIQVVISALSEPLKTIAKNAGDKPDVVIDKVLEGSEEYGFDASNSTYGNMFETGIIDPTTVVKAAMLNAGSVAGLLLTTDCAIYEIPDEETKSGFIPAPPAGHELPQHFNNGN